MPSTSKNAGQAAEHMARDLNITSWNGTIDTPITITFGFRNSAPTGVGNNIMSPDSGSFSKFTTTQMKFAELALDLWADVARIDFDLVETKGDYAEFNDADLLFANYNSGQATQFASAYAYSEATSPNDRFQAIWMNGTIPGNKNPVIGQFDFETYLHEIGHTLGLSHPGDYNAGPNEVITYNTHAEYIEDSVQYSVMSYFTEKATGANWAGMSAMTPMIHDIAAVHRLYGANMNTRTGDSVYGFNSAETPLVPGTLNIYGMASASDRRIFSVWDAGGTDTFDFSKYMSASIIDINNGKFSSVGGLTFNIGIALDPLGLDELIENAIGGFGNDSIEGNKEANTLTGNGGNDTLRGSLGSDTLDGGVGNDILIGIDILGTPGDDILKGGDGIDTASYSGAGAAVVIDLQAQSASGDNGADTFFDIENATGGHQSDTITGNDKANRLEGGDGDDLIEGGAGDDVLIGGTHGLKGDTATYANALNPVTANLGLLTQQDTKGAGRDTLSLFENLIGTAFADKLTGDAKSNLIEGGAGDDYLDGAAGNDKLFGESEDDILVGGLGSDDLDGGTESIAGDTASFAGITVAVNASLAGGNGSGSYKIGAVIETDALIDIENLIGGTAADILTGDDGANVLDGAAGNDTLNGGLGDDLIVAGAGNDVVEGGTNGGGGDTVSFLGMTSAITLDLTKQNAALAINTGGAGLDKISGFENVTGGKGADKLTGDQNKNTLDGGDGNDIIEGGGDADRLFGRAGVDTLSYALSIIAVMIFLIEQGTIDNIGTITDGTAQTGGDAQGDLIWGFENITGSGSGDTLEGDGLANIILAGGGDDKVSGLGGKDTLDGGAGNDTLDLSYLGSGQNVTAALGTLNTTTGAVAKTSTSGIASDIDGVANFENMIGGDGNDKFTGNAGDNKIEGGGGNDQLFGMAGNDTLDGGAGDDFLEGGAGGDKIDGGANNDTASYKPSVLAVNIDLQNDTASGGDATGDQLDNIENLIGSAKHDTLTGDGNDNVIEGGLGNDTLKAGAHGIFGDTISFAGGTAAIALDLTKQSDTVAINTGAGLDIVFEFENIIGGAGADKLTGDTGANEIQGGAGNDIISGGDDADELHGGLGMDTLTGGADADTFHIKWGEGAGKITDFVSGTDEIELDLTVGMANPLSIISGSAPANAGPNAALLYDTDDGRLFYDSGPGVAVQIATLTNKNAIDINDFTFT